MDYPEHLPKRPVSQNTAIVDTDLSVDDVGQWETRARSFLVFPQGIPRVYARASSWLCRSMWLAVIALFSAMRCAHAQTATVVIRFDDFPAGGALVDYGKVLDVFVRNSVPVSMAVIPFPVDDASAPAGGIATHLNPFGGAEAEFLCGYMDTGLVDVVQHGYSHRANRRGKNNTGLSEFVGMPRNEQVQKIRAGRAQLESALHMPVDAFVPPYNSYDINTFQVLGQNGFSILSASRNGPTSRGNGLTLIPDTGEVKYVEDMAAFCRTHPAIRNPLVVVLMHIFDFKEVDAQRGYMTFADFEGLLARLSSRSDLMLSTLHGVAATYRSTALDVATYEADMRYVRRYYLARSVFPLGLFPMKMRFEPALPYPIMQEIPLEGWQARLMAFVR